MQIKTEWDLSPLLKSDNDPAIDKKLEEIKKANHEFIKKWKSRSDYLQKPEIMKEALDDYEKLNHFHGLSGDVGYYFNLRLSQEQANPEIKAKLNKIEETQKELMNERQFFTLNISKIKKEEQNKFLESPELKGYKHFLESNFAWADHLLSDEEEKIMNLKEAVAHDAWERMTSALIEKEEREILINGKKEKKNFSELGGLVKDKDKKIREAAATAINEIFDRYVEVAEAEINAIVTNKKINDSLRKFPRPDSSRHLVDDISTETVDALVESVASKFEISKNFYELKAKLFKVDKIKYYERATPYGEENTHHKFEDSVELVHKTFINIDKEFAEICERFLENGQVDVFPKKGRRGGAFCTNSLPTYPVYIMLNHNGSLHDVTTIAHEFGHGINAELMKRKQNSLNLETPKSTAEVASTFMEDFIFDELLQKANEEEKLVILMEKLADIVQTIFRQIAFYKFEQEMHLEIRNKGYLSKEQLAEMFKKHMNSYLGNYVDVSEAGNWWVNVPHFRYIFYVYSYASGLLISKALQKKVKENPAFIEKVKEFLSAGTSDSPENIFKKLGIDITKKEFWISGLNEIESLLNETEQLAKKLGKI